MINHSQPERRNVPEMNRGHSIYRCFSLNGCLSLGSRSGFWDGDVCAGSQSASVLRVKLLWSKTSRIGHGEKPNCWTVATEASAGGETLQQGGPLELPGLRQRTYTLCLEMGASQRRGGWSDLGGGSPLLLRELRATPFWRGPAASHGPPTTLQMSRLTVKRTLGDVPQCPQPCSLLPHSEAQTSDSMGVTYRPETLAVIFLIRTRRI